LHEIKNNGFDEEGAMKLTQTQIVQQKTITIQTAKYCTYTNVNTNFTTKSNGYTNCSKL
jgi:hypothetical protein